MAGEDRRKKILQLLKGQILNGSQLAKQLNVSRQVIVQDIALLRTSGSDDPSPPARATSSSADNTCTPHLSRPLPPNLRLNRCSMCLWTPAARCRISL